jgi:hypothetical protein
MNLILVSLPLHLFLALLSTPLMILPKALILTMNIQLSHLNLVNPSNQLSPHLYHIPIFKLKIYQLFGILEMFQELIGLLQTEINIFLNIVDLAGLMELAPL